MSRSLRDLVPKAEALAIALRERCDDMGIHIIFVYTRRTTAEQAALYAQGREPIQAVNDKRHAAGMAPITEKENEDEVTWTLNSRHLSGEAFDIAIMINGKIDWYTPLYQTVGQIGEDLGLCWLGRTKKTDAGHFELKH